MVIFRRIISKIISCWLIVITQFHYILLDFSVLVYLTQILIIRKTYENRLAIQPAITGFNPFNTWSTLLIYIYGNKFDLFKLSWWSEILIFKYWLIFSKNVTKLKFPNLGNSRKKEKVSHMRFFVPSFMSRLNRKEQFSSFYPLSFHTVV